ncbi:MAG: MFS transporter, partial [Thermoplasmataceae archaeon]
IAWTLGIQIANTTFKPEEIGASTSFFSSSMMIMSALMPLVGYMFSLNNLGFSATLWIFAAVTAVFFAWELLVKPQKPTKEENGRFEKA